MPYGKRRVPEEEAGAPEWMVTFSDCMTLLLTFFVLLLSFSSFDENEFFKLKVIFSKEMASLTLMSKRERDAIMTTPQIQYIEDLDSGVEKPSLEKSTKDISIPNFMNIDFYKYKVFRVESEKVFLGKGTIFSPVGKNTLSTMVSFLNAVPGRVVISENDPGAARSVGQLGLSRAWTVMDYFVKNGFDKNRLSISATTLSKGKTGIWQEADRSGSSERMLEIVLLERNIHS